MHGAVAFLVGWWRFADWMTTLRLKGVIGGNRRLFSRPFELKTS
ncbi:hypothetical protein ACLK1T_09130 [Escherichia coli]